MAENHHSDHQPPPDKHDLGRITAWVILTLVIVGHYWKLVLTNQFTWLSGQDYANQVLPWFQYQAGEWHAGRLPLWEPFQWMGQPLVGQAQPGVFYPLNWILFLLPLRDGWLKPTHLHWYLVLIHLMGAWFAYLLARDLKLSRRAAILAGTIFSLAGWLGTVDWPQMISGAVWTPLVFMHVLRAARGERVWRSAVLGGFFLGMAWLAGHHQIPIFVSLAVAGVWIWTAAQDRRKIAAMALFFTMAGMTGAAQIVPSMEYGKRAVRWVGSDKDPVKWDQKVPYYVHRHYGFGAVSVVGILFPHVHFHANGHHGAAALTLMLLGCALCWRRTEVRVLAFVGIGALFYSLAAYTPLEGILYSLLPMVEKARTPAFAIFVFGFATALLAGFGLDGLAQNREHPWVKRAAQVLLIFGVGVFVLAAVIQFTSTAVRDGFWIVTGIAALTLSALLTGYRRSALATSTLFVGALGLFMTEIASTNGVFLPYVEKSDESAIIRSLSQHGDIAQFLRSQPGLWRVDVDDKVVPYNFGDFYGFHQYTGYLASVTANVFESLLYEDAGRRMYGSRFRISDKPTEFHATPVFTSSTGLKVFENTSVLPRAYAVHRIEQAPKREALNNRLREFGLDELRQQVVMLASPPPLDVCDGSDDVAIERYEPSRVAIRANMACKGMVVLADSWFPGWRATVDGSDVELHEVNGVLRGVVVEKGSHTIEMRYRPLSVAFGVVLSLIGLSVAAGSPLIRRRRD